METIENFIERIKADIQERYGCEVYEKKITDGYHLRRQFVFAWVRRVENGRVVPKNVS